MWGVQCAEKNCTGPRKVCKVRDTDEEVVLGRCKRNQKGARRDWQLLQSAAREKNNHKGDYEQCRAEKLKVKRITTKVIEKDNHEGD